MNEVIILLVIGIIIMIYLLFFSHLTLTDDEVRMNNDDVIDKTDKWEI